MISTFRVCPHAIDLHTLLNLLRAVEAVGLQHKTSHTKENKERKSPNTEAQRPAKELRNVMIMMMMIMRILITTMMMMMMMM